MAKKKKTLAPMLAELHDIAKVIEEDPDKTLIISENYSKLDTPFKILKVYLKVLVSVLPLAEMVCKGKTTEYSVRTLTILGEAIRQTIIDLEIYKDPEMIMNEKITPHIQFHHDEVIKNISLQLSKLKEHIMELIPTDKQKTANTVLIDFIKGLGEELRETYGTTLEKIKEELSSVRGL